MEMVGTATNGEDSEPIAQSMTRRAPPEAAALPFHSRPQLYQVLKSQDSMKITSTRVQSIGTPGTM